MGLFLPDSGLVFWMLISFGIVFGILAKFGFPVVLKMLDDRKAHIDQSLEMAEKANQEWKDMKKHTDHLLEETRKEQTRILKETLTEREEIILDAKKQAEAIAQKQVEDAKKQIELQKQEALCEIRREVAALSVDVAEKVIRKDLSESDRQMELIDSMLDDMLKNTSN